MTAGPTNAGPMIAMESWATMLSVVGWILTKLTVRCVVLAVLAAVAGQEYNVPATLNIFPRIPVNEGTLTTAGIIALLAVAVAALIGATWAAWLECTTTAGWTTPCPSSEQPTGYRTERFIDQPQYPPFHHLKGVTMIVLGIILIVLALLVASLHVLLWIGIVLLVIGVVVNLVPIGGSRRRVY